MKGDGLSQLETAKEIHAALVLAKGEGAAIPQQHVRAYIMEETGVVYRQSINAYMEAWEGLGLIESGWKGRDGIVKLNRSDLELSELAVPEHESVAPVLG